MEKTNVNTTPAIATATELTTASLANFCDNDTVTKKIADYVEAGFQEIAEIIRVRYVDAITSSSCVPSLLEFRIHIQQMFTISIVIGTKESERETLCNYNKVEDHEVFRSRYRVQLAEKLKEFGFKVWDENKSVLILSLNPRADCKL